MTVQDLECLYDYGYWVNDKLIQIISTISAEDFTRPVAGSFGSIRNTLVHVMSAERGWLACCRGLARPRPLDPDSYLSAEAVAETWARVENDMRGFLAESSEEALTRRVKFELSETETRSLPLGQLLHHVANHGVHHRGQVALLLRQLGHPPGNFDILFYYSEKNGEPWVWTG